MERGFTFEDVVVDRGGIRALDEFTTEVPGSGVTALFGASGSGKTTLLRLCNRLEVPTSGRVLFGGRDVTGLDPLRLRRTVRMGFQKPTPFLGTVRDNLLVAAPADRSPRAVRELAGQGIAVLWVSHDLAQVRRIADRVLRIEHGRAASPTPEEVRR